KEGVINLDYLLPGTYYLEEVQSPDGYYGYEELIPIEVGFQEKVVVKVDNYKEEEEKPEDKPQDEYHFSVGEKKLPRTGF
ncbi:MAG: prealbumin-like fold domain-containing protein, partial [Intestinibacter sp.]